MSDRVICVRARIKLLTSEEGGRKSPLLGGVSYRPIHNFFEPDDRNITDGFIEIPKGAVFKPGQSFETEIKFWYWPGLDGQIYPGREWRVQEGGRLVAKGTVLEVLP